MKFKIQPSLRLEFSSSSGRIIAFQILSLIRASIFSIFTFIVATKGCDNVYLLSRLLYLLAKCLYFPVYHINNFLPGHFDSFYINAVPSQLGFCSKALIFDASFSFPYFYELSKMIKYFTSPSSVQFRAHLWYSIPVYILLFNLISYVYRRLKQSFNSRA